MKRTQIINEIILKFNYDSYLEIGIRNPNHNFNKIIAKHKVGVDPNPKAKATFLMTSDEFFKQNIETFDIIFIDGLHYSSQVLKDIHNSLKFLNKYGTIVMHDCNPTTEIMQKIPRQSRAWTGDVWKAFVKIRSEKSNVKMFVIDTDYGVGIINKGKQYLIKIPKNPTYQDLENNRKNWLNLVDKNEYINYL